jgi:2,4-dienoyl-CoA reductase-like NADH-dependent reductase (Old Yellow Enzyme family)
MTAEPMLPAPQNLACLAPSALPCPLGDRRARTRVAVAPTTAAAALAGDEELVALGGAAAAGAGLVVTPPLAAARLAHDDAAVAWQRVVEFVHGKGALAVARVLVDPALADAVQRAAFAAFDLLLLDPGDDPLAIERLPSAVQTALRTWRPTGWIAACVHDRPGALGHAAQLVRAGARLLWVSSSGDAHLAGARLPAAPLADRLRNELSVATAVVGNALVPDLDAAIAAGRADLVVVTRAP